MVGLRVSHEILDNGEILVRIRAGSVLLVGGWSRAVVRPQKSRGGPLTFCPPFSPLPFLFKLVYSFFVVGGPSSTLPLGLKMWWRLRTKKPVERGGVLTTRYLRKLVRFDVCVCVCVCQPWRWRRVVSGELKGWGFSCPSRVCSLLEAGFEALRGTVSFGDRQGQRAVLPCRTEIRPAPRASRFRTRRGRESRSRGVGRATFGGKPGCRRALP
ncbi:hypothetical protein LZ30DRAFT_408832 [Colletotrichum cereale]|nr:hypothetical protein LZ30DRAFT_408832 [Colletotrichum cereale]